MPFSETNVFARDDTFFGVCQAIGEDLGFNPNILRVTFALPLLYAPMTMIGAYFALAVVVLLTRLVVPDPHRSEVGEQGEQQESPKIQAEPNASMPIAA